MARRMLVALASVAFASLVGGVGQPTQPAQAATSPARPYDVDGDGRQELAASAPALTVHGAEDAGGVVVVPTSDAGLVPKQRLLLTQATKGILYEPEEYGYFGSGVTSADFNRDGYADLVVATPDYIGYGEYTTVLTVVPGSAHGLDPAASIQLRNAEDHDDDAVGLGRVLVAADLTGDGYPDLATGIPYDTEGEQGPARGEVQVFAGGPTGLGWDPVRVLRPQGTAGGHDDYDIGFGAALAAADLDGDGTVELVVGSSGANVTGDSYPGSVSVCPGASGGPTGCTRLLHSADVAGPLRLATGRVTGAARPDLLVAVPRPQRQAAGSVWILQLKPTGAVAINHKLVLSQASPGVPGGDEPGDLFGIALAVGDVDRDGFADVVVGASGEDRERGRVTLVHGAAGGWRPDGNVSYDQDTKGVPGAAERGDDFGSSLALLDHDGDGHLDLDVGAPGENGSGAVTSMRGTPTGLTATGARAFSLASLKIGHRAGAGFGNPLGD